MLPGPWRPTPHSMSKPLLLEAAGAAHQPVDVGQLVGHVIERGTVVAEDRDAVVIRAAAQELHHVRAVGQLEAEDVDEERDLVLGARAVEHDVADLGRPRAVENDVRVLHDVGRYAHRQPVGRVEAEAVAAAGGAGERSGRRHPPRRRSPWPWRRARRPPPDRRRRNARRAARASAARGWSARDARRRSRGSGCCRRRRRPLRAPRPWCRTRPTDGDRARRARCCERR